MTDETATLIRRIKRRQALRSVPKRIIPPGHCGDIAISLVRFMRRHRRFPGRRNLWNNHIFRLKLNGTLATSLCARVTDKEHGKNYIDEKLGQGFTVPTLGILTRPEEVPDYPFPATCCIKPTHSSGKVILREDAAPLDVETMVSWFFHSHYLRGREPNYRYLTPKIIIEPILFAGRDLTEYRFYCVDGAVRGVWVETGRFGDTRSALFDLDFNFLYGWKGASAELEGLPRPQMLDAMVATVGILAADFRFIRVDMYAEDDQFYVGELTSCDGNALGVFPNCADEALVSYYVFGGPADKSIVLPEMTGRARHFPAQLSVDLEADVDVDAGSLSNAVPPA